jgi:hypothetical protein
VEFDRVVLSASQKALRINLNPDIYGTFAEIGAGQEVVRHFFRAGGASGTIAKAMSAYDKDFSDAIYGKETKGRYVCKPRLVNMLNHEYKLVEERLNRKQHPTKKFFSFADTVASINYQKTIQGHGWMGVKFETEPGKEANVVIIHARLHESEVLLQQASVGVLGVNLLYACFYFHENPKELLLSLYDNLQRDQIEIDTIQVSGPDFVNVDNRLLSLQLVKNGMTDAVIFSPDGRNLQAADILYKKNILALRGSFRPVTKVNIDMIMKGFKLFEKEYRVDSENIQVLFEITLNNLRAEGDINEQDFLDRADILCSLGQTVLISNYTKYYKLVEFFSKYTNKRTGIIMGANMLLELFNDKYYRDLNGGILEAFGILFSRDMKIYLYPWQDSESGELITVHNCPIHPRLRPLYDYLVYNKRLIDITDFNPEVLNIYSKDVLDMIKHGYSGWENMVPAYVDTIIKENRLFGYDPETKPDANYVPPTVTGAVHRVNPM